MIRWLRSLFAWRTIYENHSWWLNKNTITGERTWIKKPGGGHVPLPMVDDDGKLMPMGSPPAKPSR